MTSRSTGEQFWPKVNLFGPGGCWEWIGVRRNGYGRAWIDGRYHSAHRVAYELLVDPIPSGLTIDHLCRNPSCVNPKHLEAVTMRENTLRGDTIPARNAAKTHCIRGHSLTAINVYVTKSGRRQCRICRRLRRRKLVMVADD